jgi:ribose transport system permease protein
MEDPIMNALTSFTGNFRPGENVSKLTARLAAVVVVGLVLAFASDAFLTAGNLLNVLRQASLLFLMASGLTLVVLTGGIDLSIGANVALSACLAGTVIKATGSPVEGAVVAIACGTLVGLANGVLVAVFRMPSFIATYGMMWLINGYTYYFMAGNTIYGFPHGFRQLGSGYLFSIPVPVYLMLVFLALAALFAGRTIFGQQVYAMGSNPVAARFSGVPVKRRLVLVYLLSGLMAGLGSLVFLARLNSAEGDIGAPLTLPAIAAVLIGGTSLFGGIGTPYGTLIGALLLTLVLNGLNLLNIDANWQPLVTGAIIIIAVLVDSLSRRRQEARA